MRKQTKKGFTIVELVIVIALIAILAAVLIPTFSNVINNAHESNDTVMVKNLNTILNAEENSGNPAANMTEAIYQAKEGGYNVDKLTPTSSGDIVWDQVSNRFVLINAKGKVVFSDESKTEIKDDDLKTENAYRFWKITSDIENDRSKDAGYSWYLADGYKGKTPINATTGIDVGTNEGVTVNYVNDATDATAKNVLLRTNGTNGTNGGTLTVNAEKDTVSHYGAADNVVITAVANESYHEFGEVKAVTVEKGRVVVEKKAEVKLVIAKTADVAAVKIEAHDENTKVYAPAGVTVTGEAQVIEKTSDANDGNLITGVTEFAGGSGVEADPYLIETAEQAMKIEGYKGYFKLVADVVVEDEIYMSKKTYVFDLNGHSITLRYGDGVKPNNGSVLYIGGQGGNLTINDSSAGKTGAVYGSKETYANKVTSAVRIGNYGKLTINGGNFYGMSEGTSCIFVYTSAASGSKATVTINGGYFETAAPANGIYYVLNHQDSYTAGCTITVNGGTFKNYNPGVTEVDPDNAKTGKITLGTGCATTSETKDGAIHYTVTKQAE